MFPRRQRAALVSGPGVAQLLAKWCARVDAAGRQVICPYPRDSQLWPGTGLSRPARTCSHTHLMLCCCAAPCPWRLCGTSLPGMPMHSELRPLRHSTAQVFNFFSLSCWLCVRSGTRVLLNCVRCCRFDKCCLCMCVSLRRSDPAPLAPPPLSPLACRLAVTSNLLVGDADSQAGSRAREA